MESSKLFHHQLILCSVLFFLALISVTSQNISSTKHGFSLELIDPLSPLSPFYNPNLTDTERLNRVLESDKRRLRYLTSFHNTASSSFINPTEIRPGLLSNDLYYMVGLGIGTGAALENYYLQVNTGSSLTWIQCKPCKLCFEQQPRLFDPPQSPTYAAIKSDNPLCRAPIYKPGENGQCDYKVDYADESYAIGVLSSDTFNASTNQAQDLQVPNVVFGCTQETGTGYPLGGPVGILGMNLEPESFIMQDASAAATGKRFSYCLVEPGSNHAMTLRLGADIAWPPAAKTQETPILRVDNGFGLPYVNLVDMNIDNTGIYFPPGTFDRDPNGHGGFMIDSGSFYSYLPDIAYQIVRSALALHFQARGLLPVHGKGDAEKFDLCFDLAANADPATLLPSLTFNFEGAQLPLSYAQVFYIDSSEHQFCFAMFPEQTGIGPGVLGAFQQVNTQFEFDMSQGSTLRFATVDCTNNV